MLMRILSSILSILCLSILTGCQQSSDSPTAYITTDSSKFIVGESYRYLGDGKFEHQKVVNWKDLK